MAIRNLISSSYNYSSESYGSGHLNWSLEDEAENKSAADVAIIDAESEIDSAEHAANAADAMAGVLEVAESTGGEVTENEASLIDDVNTAVAGGATDSEEAPIAVSSESNGRYYISKEGIVDKIKEIWKRIKEAIMRVWNKLKDAYKKYFGVYKNMIRRAEKIKKRSDDMSGKTIEEKTIEYSNNVSMLYLGDGKINNVTELEKALKAVEDFCNMKKINDMLKVGDEYIEVISSYTGDDTESDGMVTPVKKMVTGYLDINPTGNDVIKFVAGKKIYRDGTSAVATGATAIAPTAITADDWSDALVQTYAFKIRIDDYSDKALSDSVNFTTMKTNEISKICDKVIELCKVFTAIASSAGIDKLETKKDKMKDASDKMDKRLQQHLKDDGTTAHKTKEFNILAKANTSFAGIVSTFSTAISKSGEFMGVALTLCEKSLSNHKTR